ncbi:hypothetical protein NQ317_005765 [Molorchus minor]|uniref:Uncharacterized protein n=1 Tax=Molorchus minor TaxID=1323400 RepID=A0ABQ9JDF3_9CUCU|nr:hypothetical protein NQ317_005765 [Molorchus minor]
MVPPSNPKGQTRITQSSLNSMLLIQLILDTMFLQEHSSLGLCNKTTYSDKT